MLTIPLSEGDQKRATPAQPDSTARNMRYLGAMTLSSKGAP